MIQYYSQCGGLCKVDTENGEENSPPLGGPGSFDQPVCSCLPMGHIIYMRGAGSPVAFIICKYLGKDGKINESDLYAISNYIPVRAGTEYTYNISTGGAYCTIYDAGFQAMGDFKGNSSLTIPENGCYVRLSFPYSSTDAMFYEKSQDDGLYDKYCSLYSFYKQYVQDKVNLETSLSLKLDKVLTKNLFNKDSENIIRERYLGSSGNIATNTMYFVSDFIPVEPGETYYPYNFGAGGAYHCVYEEDQRTVVLAFKDTAVTIPETGRYVRLSGVLSRLDSQQFEKGEPFPQKRTQNRIKKLNKMQR